MSKEDFEVLFVDDEKPVLDMVKEYLTRTGYRITVVDSGRKAFDLVRERDIQIVFTDLKMPDLNGLDLLKSIKEYRPKTEVVIITGYASVETAVEALQFGGYDYLQKPIKLERLTLLIDRISENKRLEKENIILKRGLKAQHKHEELIGISPGMREISEIIERISMDQPAVLIQGESGTGKEVVANVIHKNSECRDKPFISINCGAIVEGLLESELFGHVKGAFTGAINNKTGLFEAANGGTIFLDEIVEMPVPLQVKLLRVLQERKIRPVGSTNEFEVDVRIIAATNQDPERAAQDGTLRQDLFYRINVVSIKIPPLRERKEDIPLLINHFLAKFNKGSHKNVTSISPGAMDILEGFHWPGNVRQLENVIERAFALGVEETITVHDLPSEIRKLGTKSKKREKIYNLNENEKILIQKALHKTKGSKAEAAKLLGINITTLYRKAKRYGI